MDLSQIALVAIVVATIGLFLWGRWRHDLVALASLLSCVIVGVIPAESAFSGFGHPAVITVACVLILSAGLEASGAVQVLAQKLLPRAAGPMISLTVLALLGALLSAFMNNVGAMAMLMPLALQVAARHELPPGRLLMPLAFATIFGGMTTLIGTPPNLIVAGFRAEHANGAAFTMFDFAPVGLAVAGSGLLFLLLLGWRLVPVRSGRSEGFDTARYMTEVRVSEGASVIGKRLREVDAKLEDSGAQVVALIRNELRMLAPSPGRLIKEGDLLVLEAEPDSFGNAIGSLGLKLEEEVEPEEAPEAAGERFIATASRAVPMIEIAHTLRERLGDRARKVPRRRMPNPLVRVVALFSGEMRDLLPLLGKARHTTSAKAERMLGWQPRPWQDAVVATAESLLELGLVAA